MQIIKPKSIGLLHKTYLWQQHRFVVGGLVFFRLGEAQPQPLTEYDQWGVFSGQLTPGNVLDMGFAKARGEVLLSAKGYQARHKLTPVKTAVAVAKLNKQVRLKSRAASGAVLQEYLPLDVMDSQRQQYNGTYDKRWLEKVHPGLPADTDPRFFQAAPADQQLKRGFFNPGSEYSLQHMHPQLAEIKGSLPDHVVRVFVEQQLAEPDQSTVHELPMALETLWFFPEVMLGVCLYRGQFPCLDSDGLDIKRILLAMEHSKDEARPVSYYQDLMALRSNPKTAFAHLFNETPMLPKRSEQEEAQRQALIDEATAAQQAEVGARRDSLKEQMQEELDKRLPGSFPGQDKLQQAMDAEPAEDEWQMPVVPAALIEQADFDLTPLLERTNELQEKLTHEMQEKQQELQDMAESYKKQYEGETARALESDEDVQQRCHTQVFVEAADLDMSLEEESAQVSQLLAQVPAQQLQELQQQGHMNETALQQALAMQKKSIKQGRQSAPAPMVQVALTQAQNEQVRSWVENWLASDQVLAGRDLAGADLAGLDFSGRDLRDVMFECANLQGCNFSGARLDGAVFCAALLDKADFSRASLQRANFCTAKGSAANFSQALMHSCLMMAAELTDCNFSGILAKKMVAQGADLSGGQFVQAQLQDSILSDARLNQAVWDDATVQGSILMNAQLDGSRWHRARLSRCIAVNVQGRQADFSEARLDTVQFSNEGCLSEALFHRAYCQTVGFRGLDLSDMSARDAVFKECDFCEAQLTRVDFTKSLLVGCLLMQIDSADSQYSEACFSTSMVRKVNFTNSNLDDAEFNQCTLAEINFDKSSTRRLHRHPQANI